MALPSTSNQQPTSTNEEPSRMSDYLRSNLKWFTNRAAPMQNTPEGNFFLKNDEEEVDRTLVHHGAMKMAFGSNFTAPMTDLLQAGARVLDVGCGPGFWVMDVATEYPLSQFTGIDIDSYVLPTSTMPQNTEFECVDVFSMPYAEGTFDFVYIRAMFTYFREEQWVDILREIARVTKSGGYIEVQDASMIFKDFGPIGTAYAEAFGKVMVANKRNLSHATFLTNVFATTMRDTFEFVSKHDVDVPTCHDQELGRQMQEDFAYLARPLIEMLALQGSDDLTKSIDGISFDDAFGEFTTHKTTIGFFSLVAKRL